MALADYTSLQASIGSWIHRSDYTSIAPDLIALFESDFNNDPDNHCRQMENETSITATSGYLPLPTDWLAWKVVQGTDGGFNYRVPTSPNEAVIDRTFGEASGSPRYLVMVGSKAYLKPPQAGTYPTVYVASVPVLSASNTTNWLLTKFPNLYLFGALANADAFNVNDQRVALWKTLFQESMQKFKADIRRAKFGATPQMLPDRTA